MKGRVPAQLLGVSVAIVSAWIAAEGFTAAPVIPVRGDVPTIGHGSTQYEDGTPVTMADPPITRTRARELAVNLLEQRYGQCVRDSLGDTLMHPVEFEQAVDFAGQYGCGAWRASSMLRDYQAGRYVQACEDYLAFRFMTSAQPLEGFTAYRWDARGRPTRWRYDCSTPGNRVCRGVWTRQLGRNAKCKGVQS